MRRRAIGGLIVMMAMALVVLTGALTAAEPPRYLSRGGLALGGYDAVAYFTDGKAVRGDVKFEITWDGARWRFASAENRDRFTREPQRYAPQFGGYCAYAISQGHTASGDPEAWSIVEGKLYVNYSPSVKRTWDMDQAGYIKKANANWPSILKK
jgi:YHS domain-containing protein